MATTTKTREWCKPEAPICPDCGELECLCRPRFFAGQLLSEEDLNRLDRYIVKKHRLHNRYLHGWGVVCGLEVRCHPCDDLVTVSPGYALSPCGDDIVVCKPDTVDICKLIKRCRNKEHENNECRPYGFTPDCKGAEEDWILAIRYEEQPSRGITALRGGTCEETAKSCDCDTGEPKATFASTNKSQTRRGAPTQCEPTLTCEGYHYEVFRAPPEPERDPRRDPNRKTNNPLPDWLCSLEGPMIERICCCWEELINAIPKQPTGTFTRITNEQWFQWCCAVKAALTKYFVKNPGYNCQIIERLHAIVCPNPDSEGFQSALAQVQQTYALIVFEVMVECLCSAALPQCPEPSRDPRIPLASIRIRTKDCKILRVCNWTPLRQFAVTIPMLNYWLSWLPMFEQLREGIHKICCDMFGLRKFPRTDFANSAEQGFAGNQQAGTAAQEPPTIPVGVDEKMPSFATELFKRMRREPSSMSSNDFASALLGHRGTNEEIALTDANATSSPEFRLLNEMVIPLIAGLGPDLLSAIVGPSLIRESGETAGQAGETAALRAELQQMRADLKAQEDELTKLRTAIEKLG